MKTQLVFRCKTVASTWLAVGCLTSGVVFTANASLISNGSFEAPALSPGGYATLTPTDWSLGGGASTYLINNAGNYYSNLPLAQEGDQFVALTANIGWTLYQQFQVDTAGTYEISWYHNVQLGYLYAYSYDVSLLSGANSVYSANYSGNGSGPNGTWHALSVELSLAAGNYTLQFATGSGGGAVNFWDNVSVDAAAVPEPSTYIAGALLLLPMAASTLRVVRKQNHS